MFTSSGARCSVQTQRHSHSLTRKLFGHYIRRSRTLVSEMFCGVLCCLCQSSVERSCWQWKWHDETSSFSTKDAVSFPHCHKTGKAWLCGDLAGLQSVNFTFGNTLSWCSCWLEDAEKLRVQKESEPSVFSELVQSRLAPWTALPSLWSLPDFHNLKESRAAVVNLLTKRDLPGQW